MRDISSFPTKLKNFLASRWFFYVILALLVLQAGFFALTARYPQAFDEQWHFGLINIYSHQWSPFFSHQPANSFGLGELVYNPSYFYHYLLSFALRILRLFTSSMTAQLIALRFINIGLFTGGLVLFRKLLKRMGLSQIAAHGVLLFLVFIPVTPLLAGQLNYDNLLFLLSGWSFLWFLGLWQEIRQGYLPAVELLGLIAVNAFASITKYEFLPIFAIEMVLLLVLLWRTKFRALRSFARPPVTLALVVAVLACLIGLGLDAQRYGTNFYKFRNVEPNCTVVLSDEECRNLGPYNRNANLAQMHIQTSLGQKLNFPISWVKRMIYELDFTISSAFGPQGEVDYFGADPLPVVTQISWVVLDAGIALGIFYSRRLWRDPVLRNLLLIGLFYALVLAAYNFKDFVKYGVLLAVHGRYLYPVILIYLGVIARCLQWAWAGLKLQSRVRLHGVAIVVFLVFLQGGGLVTYLIRWQPSWSWPQSQLAQSSVREAKNTISPFVLR